MPHRPLYDLFVDWVKDGKDLEHNRPRQYEFNKLNLNYTLMSKRNLLILVKEGMVSGWDDPRMPTLCGFRRRGYSPESIRGFVDKIGGALLSLVVYCLVLSLLLGLFRNINSSLKIVEPEVMQSSVLIGPIERVSDVVFPYLVEAKDAIIGSDSFQLDSEGASTMKTTNTQQL